VLGDTTSLFGLSSWVRMISASTPPAAKKASVVQK
jgi:hypothetical protein